MVGTLFVESRRGSPRETAVLKALSSWPANIFRSLVSLSCIDQVQTVHMQSNRQR